MTSFLESLEQQHRDRLRNSVRSVLRDACVVRVQFSTTPCEAYEYTGMRPQFESDGTLKAPHVDLDKVMAELEADDEFMGHARSCLPIGDRLDLTGPMEQHVLVVAQGMCTVPADTSQELASKAKASSSVQPVSSSPASDLSHRCQVGCSMKLRQELIAEGRQQALVDVWKIIGSGIGWANTYKLAELPAAWDGHCKGLSSYWEMKGRQDERKAVVAWLDTWYDCHRDDGRVIDIYEGNFYPHALADIFEAGEHHSSATTCTASKDGL